MCLCTQKDKCGCACYYRRAREKVQSTCKTAVGLRKKSQNAVTSVKCLLCAADAHFKTLMKFFPLVWFSICLACTTARRFEFFSSILPSYLRFIFFLFFSLLVVMFSVLKQAHQGKQYTMFECVLTPRLHRAWFPRGKWAFGMFTFCFHFCVASKTLPLFLFPTALQTRCSPRENRCWPVSCT